MDSTAPKWSILTFKKHFEILEQGQASEDRNQSITKSLLLLYHHFQTHDCRSNLKGQVKTWSHTVSYIRNILWHNSTIYIMITKGSVVSKNNCLIIIPIFEAFQPISVFNFPNTYPRLII